MQFQMAILCFVATGEPGDKVPVTRKMFPFDDVIMRLHEMQPMDELEETKMHAWDS